MKVAYPTMDTVGFITTPSSIAERILSDYRCTNHSQSAVIQNLRSLTKALQSNSSDIQAFAAKIQSDLEGIYQTYLDDVLVEVNAVPTVDTSGRENDCVLNIQIRVRYRNGSQLEELAKSIQYDNKGFSRLVELVNE